MNSIFIMYYSIILIYNFNKIKIFFEYLDYNSCGVERKSCFDLSEAIVDQIFAEITLLDLKVEPLKLFTRKDIDIVDFNGIKILSRNQNTILS